MDRLLSLLESISNQTSLLLPPTLPLPTLPTSIPYPLDSIPLLTRLINHLTTTAVHDVYFPFLRFGVVHAIRVTTVWALMTKGRKQQGLNGQKVGMLQDLVGYLTLAWGGGTLVSLLLNEPPSWLISPTPWLIYPTIYLLLIPTGLSSYITSTFPTFLFDLLTAYVDGTTRGVTLSALPTAVSASRLGSSGWWTYAILSAIAVCGGGWLVQAFGLHQSTWTLGKPSVLDGGILGTLDLWSGALVGLLYLVLTRKIKELDHISDMVLAALPDELHKNLAEGRRSRMALDHDSARAICVLVLGCLFAARVITISVMGLVKEVKKDEAVAKKVGASGKKKKSTSSSLGVDKVVEELMVEADKGKEGVIKTPTSKNAGQVRERKSTPRKSPKPK